MTHYLIRNVMTGDALGTVEAPDPLTALDAHARAAGYADHEQAVEAAGGRDDLAALPAAGPGTRGDL